MTPGAERASGPGFGGRRVEAIRRRKSYRRFRGFLEFLETGPAAEHILYRAHALVDEYHGFGSRVASGYARECIDLLVAERRERR